MRITDETRFAHPVLGNGTGDLPGDFEVLFEATEDARQNSLLLQHEIVLSNPEIEQLIRDGLAEVRAIVQCQATYFTDLRPLSYPPGTTEFRHGSLLDRVTVRPLILLRQELSGWNPAGVNTEFDMPMDLSMGDIIGMDDEKRLSVGKAKLAEIESIFELDVSDELEDDLLTVELDRDRIGIVTGQKLADRIQHIRAVQHLAPVAMTSIYLPALMSVLAQLSDSADDYEGYRWHRIFTAKLDSLGVDISDSARCLEIAQRLLKNPMGSLEEIDNEGART